MYAFNNVITDFIKWCDSRSCWMMKHKPYALNVYCNIKDKLPDYGI